MNAETIVWKNARLSILEGSFYAVMVALGESFLIPFGLACGLRPTQIGILATLPPCLGGVSQFLTPWINQAVRNRKAMAIVLMGLQIAGLTMMGVVDHPTFAHFLVAAILYWMGGDGINPLWVAWMIPEKPSQRIMLYHANRGTVLAFISFVFFMLGGFLKTRAQGVNLFQVFFIAAAVARVVSLVMLLFHVDRPAAGRDVPRDDLTMLTKSLPRPGLIFGLLGALVVFRGFAGVSSPHFTQYMLGDLQFSYMTFTFLISCGFLGRTLLLRNWVKSSHRFGSSNTLIVCCLTITVVPLLWLAHLNVRWEQVAWIAMIQAVAGAAWIGFDQLTLFIMASLGLRHWSRTVGLLGMLGTLAAVGGGWYGGYLLETGQGMATVIWVSCLGRMLATIALFIVFRTFYRETVKPMKFIPIFFATLSLRPSLSNINRLLWKRVS